jgi:hypothetical protein
MRSVFVSTGAFLGRIDGETRCALWADDPSEHGFDPARLIAVDLARTPTAAAAGRIAWSEVEVDDAYAAVGGGLGGSTLGVAWPELQLAGVIYLEIGLVARLPAALRPPCPPLGGDGFAHEYTSAVYWPGTGDPRAGRRYVGHHAVIVEEHGRLARVAVRAPGSVAAPYQVWLDLAAPDQCDAGIDALTQIGLGDAPKEGALFLVSGHLSALSPEDEAEAAHDGPIDPGA